MEKVKIMIKGILLDLDNTLYGYEVCNEYAKSELFHQIEKDFGKEYLRVAEAFDAARNAVNKSLKGTAAAHSRLLYIQRTLEILGISAFHAVRYHDLFWEKYSENMRLFDGAIGFLERAKNSRMKICIVTDLLAEIQLKKMSYLGIDRYIDIMVSSEEAGADKPAPEIFLLALEKLGMKKEDVVMIGDDEEKDIKGAEGVGIRAIRAYPSIFASGRLAEMLENI